MYARRNAAGTILDRDAEVTAFHPGPPRDFAFPNPPFASPDTQLADAEQLMLERTIERFAGRDGHMANLARRIIVLRAQVRMRAAAASEGSR